MAPARVAPQAAEEPMRHALVASLFASSLIGCAHNSDIEMGNPLVVGSVEQNQIVKPHEHAENQHGLPRGSMDDQATIISASDTEVCIDVTMHELDPIDFREADFKLTAKDSDVIDAPKVDSTPARAATYDGLVEHKELTGHETYCADRNGEGICTSWKTRPTYTISMVPGPVQVYEARGRLCFDNSKRVLSSNTPQLALEIKMRRRLSEGGRATPMAKIMSFGLAGIGGNKSVVFRWGFGGKGNKG
jgi:hypothetical protein